MKFEQAVSGFWEHKKLWTFTNWNVLTFRPDLFEIEDKYEYDDGSEELQEDTFEREPFIILVKALRSPGEFSLVL